MTAQLRAKAMALSQTITKRQVLEGGTNYVPDHSDDNKVWGPIVFVLVCLVFFSLAPIINWNILSWSCFRKDPEDNPDDTKSVSAAFTPQIDRNIEMVDMGTQTSRAPSSHEIEEIEMDTMELRTNASAIAGSDYKDRESLRSKNSVKSSTYQEYEGGNLNFHSMNGGTVGGVQWYTNQYGLPGGSHVKNDY